MSPIPQEETIEAGQAVEVDHFRPADAPGVAACFQAVYGPDYPVRVYYQPAELIAAVQAQDIICVVARTPRGEVVGVVNLFRSAPFAGAYEVGAGLVLKHYRQRGLNGELIGFLLNQAASRHQVPVIFGEAVCNHIYQQRTQQAMSYLASALEVDLMPAAAYSHEASASGRVAAVLAFRSFQAHQQTLYLPAPYQERLRAIYDGLGLERSFRECDPLARAEGPSQLEVKFFDFAATARLACPRLGQDFQARLDQELAGLEGKGAWTIQVSLPLADPLVGRAVAALRARGFFVGGLLPRWFDQDGLLMQRMAGRPHWEGIAIHGERNQFIHDLVHQDWQDIQASRQPAE